MELFNELPQQGGEKEKDIYQCPKCGKIIEEKDNKCLECGKEGVKIKTPPPKTDFKGFFS